MNAEQDPQRLSPPPPDPDDDAPGGTAEGASRFVTLGLVFYGILAASGVIWRMGFYGEPIFFVSQNASDEGLAPLFDLGVGLAAGGLLILVSDWMTRGTRWGEELARAMAAALGRLSLPDALLLALASGIAEEVFFRGAVQPRVGWLPASLLFGCIHFVPRREFLPWTGFAILAGLLFGALFAWTGNLLAPIAAHVLVNGVNLPLLVRRYGPDASED